MNASSLCSCDLETVTPAHVALWVFLGIMGVAIILMAIAYLATYYIWTNKRESYVDLYIRFFISADQTLSFSYQICTPNTGSSLPYE